MEDVITPLGWRAESLQLQQRHLQQKAEQRGNADHRTISCKAPDCSPRLCICQASIFDEEGADPSLICP